jgi:hypothetical protein
MKILNQGTIFGKDNTGNKTVNFCKKLGGVYDFMSLLTVLQALFHPWKSSPKFAIILGKLWRK